MKHGDAASIPVPNESDPLRDRDRMVQEHCCEIERCNQRGGRMLSVVDLIDAGTMDLEMAAYLLDAVSSGSSGSSSKDLRVEASKWATKALAPFQKGFSTLKCSLEG